MTNEVDSKNELFTALSIAQGEFTPVQYDKKVDFDTKKGGRVKYNYASFAAIMRMAQKPLSTNGLSVFQVTENNNLITILAHKSGQSITSVIPVPGAEDIKQLGANLSYLRRYQYTSIIGAVVADEDNEEMVEGKVTRRPPALQESTPAKSKPKSSPAQPAAGFPTVVAEVNTELGEEKYNVYHAQNAIKKEIGDFKVPGPDDTEALEEAKKILLARAKAPSQEDLDSVKQETKTIVGE